LSSTYSAPYHKPFIDNYEYISLGSVEELFCSILREIPDIFRYDSFYNYIQCNENNDTLPELHKYNIRAYKK